MAEKTELQLAVEKAKEQQLEKTKLQLQVEQAKEQRSEDKALIRKEQKEQDERTLALLEKAESFDWEKMSPPLMALLLTKRPIPRGRELPPRYLSLEEAIFIAAGCFADKVNPLGKEIWIDGEKLTYNVTTEGKRNSARRKGMDFGPPAYERLTRKLANGTDDIGYKCRMRVGSRDEYVEYTAWLSEWNMPLSPMWKAKPEHMLQVRAQEKAISFASGVGISDLPDERDIDSEPAAPIAAIAVTPATYQPMKYEAPVETPTRTDFKTTRSHGG